jgi:3-(methylthio)propanoyl-CoA dehydrogenase
LCSIYCALFIVLYFTCLVAAMQKKENFFQDNPDLQFFMNQRLDFETLFKLTPATHREVLGVTNAEEYKSIWLQSFDQIGEISGTIIAKNQQAVAKKDVVLRDGEVVFPVETIENMKALIEVGLPGLGIDPEYGGLPSPISFELPLVEMIFRACPSTFLNATWFSAIARVIDEFGSKAQKDLCLPKIASGEWSGNMALTEPDAGSDLGAIATYAEPQGNGKVKLFGSKRFISNGCGMVSLVLAKRTKGAEGLKELNLYLCLRKKPDGQPNYTISKIEEKVGLHGSATCELQFEGSDAELIGEDGKGFDYMLHLMNEARIAVAFQGLGIMEAVIRVAKQYTSERKAWGRAIAQHEMIAERLLDMEVSAHGLRSLCFQAGSALALSTMSGKLLASQSGLNPDELEAIGKIKKQQTRRLRRWTPLVKYFSGEWAFKMARDCMQMHGGYGYSMEYIPQLWLRESLIIPVYEGTSQIQALMCLKDSMKDIIRNPTTFIESALGTKVQAVREKNPLKRKLNALRQDYNASLMAIIFKLVKKNVRQSMSGVSPSDVRQILKIVTKDLIKFESLQPAILHAERITELKLMVAVGESLIRDADVDSSREWIAERWLNRSLPDATRLRMIIETDEPVLTKRLERQLINANG